MLRVLRDRARLAQFLRRRPGLHLYSLGDLDDFFWPQTQFWGWEVAGELQATVLLYSGFAPPVLLALAADEERSALEALLAALLPRLPAQLYVHGSPGVAQQMAARYTIRSAGMHVKLLLQDGALLPDAGPPDAVVLTTADLPALQQLYTLAYPDNAFDPRTLATGQMVGVWRDGRLVAVAGVHVYSAAYRVAALGNVATDPAWRGQGLGRHVTGVLCRRLLETVDTIGLNVKADNGAALAVYRRLGFVPVADYEEFDAARAG